MFSGAKSVLFKGYPGGHWPVVILPGICPILDCIRAPPKRGTLEISLGLRPQEISWVSEKSFGRLGWIFQYLPRFGGARIQCLNLLFGRSCTLDCVQYCGGDIHWQVMVVVMVPLMVMVMVMLDGHIHPQAVEATTTTNLGRAKTRWRIWSSDSHFGSTDQNLEVCAFKSILYAIWKLVCLMWVSMLQMQQTILYPVSFICQDQGQDLSSRSIQTASSIITFKQ